jgi:3-oxoadipate enol-lactonase
VTVVLLHPVGLDRECWQFASSPAIDTAVRYDLLWHGGRPKPEPPLTLEAMADDLVANVSGPLDLVGVSMGGAVARYVALRHPGRVRSLMLCASGAGGNGIEQRERADAVLAHGIDGVMETTLARWFTPEALAQPGHPAIAYVRGRLQRDTPEQFAAGWLALGANRSFEHLGEIAAPTSVVHPERDNSSLASKQSIADRLQVARLEVIPGPHMVQLEEPEAFADAVEAHFAWVAGR